MLTLSQNKFKCLYAASKTMPSYQSLTRKNVLEPVQDFLADPC